MKNALWNTLSLIAFLGILTVMAVFAVIFLNPYSPFNPLPPPTMPAALFIPSNTPTQPRLPETWTPVPSDQQVIPNLKPSATYDGSTTPQFIMPTKTLTPTVTRTSTSSPTVILRKTTVSSYNYQTPIRTPTKSRTPTPNKTGTALAQFATNVKRTQVAATATAAFIPNATQTAAALPPNPSSAVETGGAQSDVWQRTVSDPSFTWTPLANVLGYLVNWGTDPNGTSVTTTVTSAAFNPAAVNSGVYYLRLRTAFVWGTRTDWTTVFVFRYDGTSPSVPNNTVETQAVENKTWQNTVSDPSFSWDASTDSHSGMAGGLAGYEVYFGPTLEPTPNVTPTPSAPDFTTDPKYDPPEVPSSGKYDLIVRSVDYVGNKSGWATIFEFWYDGTNPTVPADLLTADPVTSTTPQFTWSASTDDASGLDAYEIFWGPDASCGAKNQPDTSGTTFTAPEITIAQEYRLCVRARDNAGNTSGWAETTFLYTP